VLRPDAIARRTADVFQPHAPRYIRLAEVAPMLRVSERRVQAMAKAGRFVGAVQVGRMWLVPVDRLGRPTIRLARKGPSPVWLPKRDSNARPGG